MKQQCIHIIGAGLAGTLLAILLVQKGHQVKIFEKRADPRKSGMEGGRSINLALAYRGLYALQQAGLDDEVMPQVVMMRGRMVHDLEGNTNFLRYGKDDSEVIWSVHRGRLNLAMIEAAEKQGVAIQFDAKIDRIDIDAKTFRYETDGEYRTEPYERLIGSDGAGSAVRHALVQQGLVHERSESLGHNYRELEIAPDASGEFRLDANSLHIWPRGGFMCIALPNTEKTFTVTLFLPAEGEVSFSHIESPEAARFFFRQYFPDALGLIADFDHDWTNNPESRLSTLYLDTWHHQDSIVLIGDAAHAMVPFHGQGMNCAFEDCVALAAHLQRDPDTATAFAAFEAERKPDAAAIQQMALENYREMSDRVDDADYLLQRELERALAARHPGVFVPRYAMVSFRRLPYATAFERGRIQRALLVEATAGRDSLDGIDWTWLDREVHARLSPLDAE